MPALAPNATELTSSLSAVSAAVEVAAHSIAATSPACTPAAAAGVAFPSFALPLALAPSAAPALAAAFLARGADAAAPAALPDTSSGAAASLMHAAASAAPASCPCAGSGQGCTAAASLAPAATATAPRLVGRARTLLLPGSPASPRPAPLRDSGTMTAATLATSSAGVATMTVGSTLPRLFCAALEALLPEGLAPAASEHLAASAPGGPLLRPLLGLGPDLREAFCFPAALGSGSSSSRDTSSSLTQVFKPEKLRTRLSQTTLQLTSSSM
mmetsp:Transcript_53889/g.172771  ORF Transcript_53889/g.172771 Transcript_53889/m.172771 type:complete len:271 (-) Transcript_53889:325-1137(-)